MTVFIADTSVDYENCTAILGVRFTLEEAKELVEKDFQERGPDQGCVSVCDEKGDIVGYYLYEAGVWKHGT